MEVAVRGVQTLAQGVETKLLLAGILLGRASLLLDAGPLR